MSTETAADRAGTAVDAIELRSITESSLGVWGAAVSVGFLRSGGSGDQATEYRRMRLHPDRTVGAFEAERCVGTLRSFPTELTLPGGALLPVSAITGVTVTQTHRRRGLLTRMMDRELAACGGRGEAAAILIAAEYNIYGRFGFGPSTRAHGWEIDLTRARGLRAELPEPAGGRLELVSMAQVGELGPALHERWRRGRPGAIARDQANWKLATGQVTALGFDWKEPFAVVHRDAAGEATGLALYSVDDNWDGTYPNCNLTVRDFLAVDQPTANSLWRYLLSVDWVRRVIVPNIGVDDPLPLLLGDPRAAVPHKENNDFTWLRVLDVPAAFGARRYASAGRVVLDVTDQAGYAAGRWALQAGADGVGHAVPTTDPADLALDASALGSLFLGAEPAGRLAAASVLTEHRPGAAAALDLMLRTPLRAWNPDNF